MTEGPCCPECGKELPPDAPAGQCPECLFRQGRESATDSVMGEPNLPPTTPQSESFVPPSPEALAARFPHLEVLELIGKGGMGAVYKARQPRLGRFVALKILPAEVGKDPAFQERFSREAHALARLSHPNIVAVFDFGESEGLYYFLIEYVEGLNLRELILTRQLQPEQALAIVPQICEALQFAHDEGVVHRDIKPENILVDKKGRVKIADFGLAKLIGEPPGGISLTATQQVMGTLHYMAPEQMKGSHAVDHRADIYSLGIVFYEMLTGELPIGRFEPPSTKVQIDVRLDEVVLRALENEPERRYQTASEVKTDVETIASSFRPAAIHPPAQEGDERSAHRVLSGLFWLLLCANLAVLVLAIVLGQEREYSFSSGNYLEFAWKLLIHKYPVGAVMVLASVMLSVGVYVFTASLVKARSGTSAEHSSLAASEELARRRVRLPAAGLLVTGALKSLLGATLLVSMFPVDAGTTAEKLGTQVWLAVAGIGIVFGAWRMRRLQSYRTAIASAGLAVLPVLTPVIGTIPPGPWALDLLSVPIGIWAIVVLARPPTRAAFVRDEHIRH